MIISLALIEETNIETGERRKRVVSIVEDLELLKMSEVILFKESFNKIIQTLEAS